MIKQQSKPDPKDSLLESSIRTSWFEGEIKGREAGIAIGIEQGIEQGKIEVARKLIANGMILEEAAEIAGLSVEVLRSGV